MTKIRQGILEILKADSRTPHDMIATMLGTTQEAVDREIQEMEAENIIVKYTTLINPDKAYEDAEVTALIEVRVSPQREQGFDIVAERIYRFEEVQSVFLTSGAFDLMVTVKGKDMRQVALFVAQKLSTLEGVLSTATHFILKTYKDEGIVFEEKEEDYRLPVTP